MGWQNDPVVEEPPPAPHPAHAAGQHWTDDPVVVDDPSAPPAAPRMTFEQMKAAHPEEYDPSSPQYRAKYGPGRIKASPADISVGTGEVAANLASSVLSTPAAGIAGAAQAVKNVFSPGMSAADRVRQVQQNFTYNPRSEAGQNLQKAVSYPFQKLAEGANAAGEKVAEVTHSPLIGAGVNTAIQFLPSLLLKGRGGAAAAEETAGAPKPGGPTITEAPGVAAAKDYVARRTSLDWNSLSDPVKARLADIAKSAGALDKLDPAAVARQARLESLPVPIKATRGQLTRDTADLTSEGTLAATEAGRPLKAVRDQQSPDIVANLEVLKGKVEGAKPAQSPLQVGQSVQDAALRQKALASKANYDALYEKARATEPDAAVPATPLVAMLEQSPAVQHLSFMQSWLKKAGIESTEKTGGMTVTSQRPVKLSELADLREEAAGIASTGGTDGFYAGKVVKAIDQARAKIPAAAKAWKAAESAFTKHKTEFSDQAAVEQLVENRSRTDRSVALEDTWNKTVLGGGIEDLEKVKRSLLTGGNSATRTAGRQAWRDIRAQTIQHIIDKSTKSARVLADGSSPVSADAMQRTINEIGPDKLNSIFGPGTAGMVDRILQATKEVRTEPAPVHPGSSTVGNLVNFLERGLNRVPILGDTASGVVRAAQKVRELGATGRRIRESQRTPLDVGAQDAANSLARQANLNALGRAAPYASGTQGRD